MYHDADRSRWVCILVCIQSLIVQRSPLVCVLPESLARNCCWSTGGINAVLRCADSEVVLEVVKGGASLACVHLRKVSMQC